MRKAMPTRSNLKRSYTPHGSFRPDRGPWQSFANAHRDQISGCYLLGNGYRAYSPSLMRFCSPDRLSPFGAGGSNAYVYCNGDPVNRIDPSGAAGRAFRPRNNSNPISSATDQGRAIGQGDIMNYAVQGLFTANNIAGVINSIVGQMEVIQGDLIGNQTATNRIATIGDFWSYTISLGTRASSFQEISASPVQLEVISYSSRFAFSSGISGTAAYAELPGRINQLWQNSANVSDFAGLALRGASRASGLDLVGRAVAHAGGNVVREVVIRIRGLSPDSHQETRL